MLKVNCPEVLRHPKVDENILEMKESTSWDLRHGYLRYTIGSWGTGRADISTRGSAPIPVERMVQAILPSEIQVMYCRDSLAPFIHRGHL
jgi:hypothetical protein